jgi:hypothetical protein
MFWDICNKMKKCCKCKQEKDKSMFAKNKKSKDGLQSRCKKCDSEATKPFREKNPQYFKNHYQENKERHLLLHQNWNNNNREYSNQYQREYRKNNIEKARTQNNIWVKDKYKNDTEYRLKHIVRSRILSGLNGKKDSSVYYLGCSINEYKTYLEQYFKPEMTWDNHGIIWEIDHIKAISTFDLTLEDEILKAFHYTNTQPLFKTTYIANELGYENEIGNRNKGKKAI